VALGVSFSATATEALRGAGCREVRSVAPVPPPGRHARDHYAAVLDPPADGPPVVHALARPDLADRPVVIAPGSGGAAKRWPMDRWAEVASILADDGVPVQWVAGPDEEDSASWPSKPACPDIAGLCALAAAAGCWLGPDSGPSHLARAVGCATLTVFGPTDPAQWAPVGGEVAAWDASPRTLAGRARALRAR
jgi:ADP-heptose:LPS heptosyltransferase